MNNCTEIVGEMTAMLMVIKCCGDDDDDDDDEDDDDKSISTEAKCMLLFPFHNELQAP